MTHFDRAAELFEDLAELPTEDRGPALEALAYEHGEVLGLLRQMLGGDSTPMPVLKAAARWQDHARSMPETIGEYQILGLLGEGGMGRVFEAQQSDPRRRVALKVIRGPFANEGQKRRFANEAQALAWLNHPGIATVFEAGAATLRGEECPYLAMERVEGEALDTYLINNSPSLSTRVVLIARICDAVQHAHEKGVVHRDLKPANVLVDASGRPKVLDFGIARLTGEDPATAATSTATGQLLGTLAYMSPEQFEGSSSEIDARADVYTLGVLLYEALSGRRPFKLAGLPLHEAAHIVGHDDPPLLGTIDQRLQGDLETIAAKALEGDRARRYATAADLAADLRRFLEHEPIDARPRTTVYKLRKFTRRNRWLVTSAASTLTALILGLFGTMTFAAREDTRAEQALSAREDALRSAGQAQAAQGRARTAAAEARAEESEARQRARVALAVRDFFLRVLNAARPSRAQGPNVTVLEALAAAEEQISDLALGDPEIEFALLSTLARVLRTLGDNDAAAEHFERAVEVAREHFGIASPEYRGSLRFLAEVYRLVDRNKEAWILLQEVLEGGSALHPARHGVPDIHHFVALGLLASLEHTAGNFQTAAEMGERALAGLRRFADEDPSALLGQLTRLSSHYLYLGNRERALETAQEAFELGRDMGFQGLDQPLFLDEAYANALDENGRTEEAVAIYEQALVKSKAWYGADHEGTARLQLNLALPMQQLGRFEEAEALLFAAHERLTVLNGPTEWKTLLAAHAILRGYAIQGRFDEGLMWVDPYVSELPGTFPGLLVQMVRGQMLSAIELHEEALEVLMPTYRKIEPTLPLGHGHLMDGLSAIHASCTALGRTNEAAYYHGLLEEHLEAQGGD